MGNNLEATHGYADIRGNSGGFSGSIGTISTPNWNIYLNLANGYSNLGGQVLDTSDLNNLHATITNNLNVFTVNATEVSNLRTLSFSGGTGDIVINVIGDVSNWGLSTSYAADKLVWNFVDATTVNISNRSIRGAVIAPHAKVTQNQNIDGFLFANEWQVNNSVELHYFELPDIDLPGDIIVTPVPEPSTTILLSALLLIPALRRRR